MPKFRMMALLIISAGLFFITSTGEAHAGLFDQGAGWLITLLIGGVGGATTYHVVQNNSQVADIPNDVLLKMQNLSPDQVTLYKVWYATNRELAAGGQFTSNLGKHLEYGDCQVAIPESHKFGSLGSSKYVRFIQRRNHDSDDLLRIVKRSGWAPEDGPQGFLKSMKFALGKASNQILVYVHGYNVSFDDAILRAAQIGFDLKVKGITTAFCWASKGSTAGYMADEDTVKLSARHLADFLALLKSSFPKHTINIIAHSMGNRALMEVLERIQNYPSLSDFRFGQIILAAPDIDAEYFRLVASAYPRLSKRTTLYVCSSDHALAVSGAGHSNIRTGYCPPITVVPGIDTIEATNVSLDMLGHRYYAEAAAVLYDMHMVLNDNKPPAKRPSLMEATSEDGGTYWRVRAVNS